MLYEAQGISALGHLDMTAWSGEGKSQLLRNCIRRLCFYTCGEFVCEREKWELGWHGWDWFLPVVVYSFSRVQLSVTPWTAARQASLSSTLPELAQIHVHQTGDVAQSPSLLPSSPSPLAFNFS